MIIDDDEKIDSLIDGEPARVGKFAATLRRNLYCEHFGLKEADVIDPLSDELNNEITRRTLVTIY